MLLPRFGIHELTGRVVYALRHGLVVLRPTGANHGVETAVQPGRL
jgi:hypothetical protein